MTDAEVERKLKKQRKREAAGEKLIKVWVPVELEDAVWLAITRTLNAESFGAMAENDKPSANQETMQRLATRASIADENLMVATLAEQRQRAGRWLK